MNNARLRKSLPAPTATAVGVVEREGRIYHLFSDGGLLPMVRGGAPDDDPPKEDPPAKTYTQAEVDRLTSREKDQGERAGKAQGMRDALTALGVDPDKVKVEDLAETLKKAFDADEAQKTEAQKAKDAADQRERTAQAREDAAAARELRVSIERALERAGVGAGEEDEEKRTKLLEKAVRLVDVEAGADSAKIKTAVDALKDDMPQLFTAASTEELPPGDPGAPPRNAGGGGATKDAQARGKALAAELGWAKEKQSA